MRTAPATAPYSSKDVLVIFGEVFNRGYINGMIEEAQKAGMTVIESTVGRRDSDKNLRPLTQEELKEKNYHCINIPLEAGFDLEANSSGLNPVEMLKGIKLKEWEDKDINFDLIEESRKKGEERFLKHLKSWTEEIEKTIPKEANIIFAHTMAGGFPRAKIVMPAANKVFKGYDERFYSSEKFWNTDIGKLCSISFNEVTAKTYKHLIEATKPLRDRAESNNAKVSYTAYGYHGSETLINGEYKWQSYSPYLQGFAKLELENISKKYFKEGINCSVYNCPEILTNSTTIFLGVEVCLYPLLDALKKEGPDSEKVNKLFIQCQNTLLPDYTISDLLKITQEYVNNPIISESYSMEGWPQHNFPEHMKYMQQTSQRLIDMQASKDNLMTVQLSEVIFKACGQLMFNNSFNSTEPVWWLNHDIIAKTYAFESN